jgi:hypothetical protein
VNYYYFFHWPFDLRKRDLFTLFYHVILNTGTLLLFENMADICSCMATEHKLIGSCIDCGRIICEKESLNICPFCHSSNVFPPLCAQEARNNGFSESAVKAYTLKVFLMQLFRHFHQYLQRIVSSALIKKMSKEPRFMTLKVTIMNQNLGSPKKKRLKWTLKSSLVELMWKKYRSLLAPLTSPSDAAD